MKFELKKRKYWWPDFVRIPFQCDPIATVALGVQKGLTGSSAVIQVPVVAKFIDTAILSAQGKAQFSSTIPWFVLLVILLGWRRISWFVGFYFTSRVSIAAEATLGLAFTDKRSKLRYHHIENQETWNLINRVCSKVRMNISDIIQRFYNLWLYSIRIFGVLLIVFTQVWWIGILTSVLCIPLMIMSLKGGASNYKLKKNAAKFERRHQYLAEVLSGRESTDERSLFGYSGHINKAWYQQFETARKIKLKADTKTMVSVRGGSIIATILSSIITLALIFPTASGQISIGMFIALATSTFDLILMVGMDLTRAVTQLSQFNVYMKDLTEFSALDESEQARDYPDKPSVPFKTLEFKNVSFAYPGTSTLILNNVNMTLHANGHYAFVGTNGAGKTTIIKLITGLYDNYDGEILINGKEMKLYTQSQLKAMFAGVYQDFARYFLSAKENVCIGNINAMEDSQTHENMIQILTTLGLHDELCSLPQGLDTPLGKIVEGGVDISGGQWQKLAMARTLINPAPVLILDEPTAALDPISESRLYEQFERISHRKTTLFISHRLGSTKLADTIFVLENGAIREEGSHTRLMAMQGIYAQMYESQRSWYQ